MRCLSWILRVFEVHQLADWAEVVTRFPFDLGRARRGPVAEHWSRRPLVRSRLAGRRPRLPRCARHGRGLPDDCGRGSRCPGGHAVLAGWNPDVTYWLRDVITEPVEYWQRPTDDPTKWLPE